MLPDPAAVTVFGVAAELPRISTGPSSSTYSSPDGAQVMRISHQFTKSRTRRMIRLDYYANYTDPITSTTKRGSRSVYLVIDEPAGGIFARADVQEQVGDLMATLSANTEAYLTKIVGSEI